MKTIIKFDILEIINKCYTSDISKDFNEFIKEIEVLKEAGFLGYQGQIEIRNLDKNTFEELIAYYFLLHLKKDIYEKYSSWKLEDWIPIEIKEMVWSILKEEKKYWSIFNEDVIKAYIEICDIDELIAILKYIKNKYKIPCVGTIYEIPEWIQYALWDRGALTNKKLFNILKENHLENFLWYHVNPYIGAPYCSKEVFNKIKNNKLKKIIINRNLFIEKEFKRL